MKKRASKNNSYNDEIDLTFFITLWNGKIKLFIIILISLLTSLVLNGNSNQKPIINEYSIDIGINNNNLNIKKFNFLSELVGGVEINLSTEEIKTRYLSELRDYEEFLDSLKIIKNDNLLKNNSNEQKELFKFIKLLKIIETENENSFRLNLKWHDTTEAISILENTLNLVSLN